jgi:hypothetical protein
MTPMYPMWEVHQLVTEHQDSQVRDADRASMRRRLRAAPRQDSEDQTTGNLGERLAALLMLLRPRWPAAARR